MQSNMFPSIIFILFRKYNNLDIFGNFFRICEIHTHTYTCANIHQNRKRDKMLLYTKHYILN